MIGIDYYYMEFQRTLETVSPALGEEFNLLSKTKSPRDVFLWLEQRLLNGELSEDFKNLLTDFYWEIA